VSAPPPSAELLAAIPGVTARLAAIMAGLAALVARALLRHPAHVVHIVPLWGYLGRTARRFQRLMDRLAAGSLRPRAPRPARRSAASPRSPRGFPVTRAWLLAALRHEAAAYGAQLTTLLEEPGSRALIAAVPQAARLLRPVCHMLGFMPAPLRLPPRRRSRPRAQAAAPPTRARPLPPARDADPPALLPRPPRPLCPRLLLRWPFNTRPAPAGA
jgi:hypothetical protein